MAKESDRELIERMDATGLYRRRDMRAVESRAIQADDFDDIDSMDLGGLREMARRLGVKVHHRAGPAKIRAAIRDRDI
ncbi:hypothetical protein [Thermomonas sp.]|uniref:hypothetical protein n=1 Tax=Thermomonas sp. TaxID=1971895 RepID=UPI002635001E|nr:hypothetical protein [Thermomonas sp.]